VAGGVTQKEWTQKSKKPKYVGGQGETTLAGSHVTCQLDGTSAIKGL